MLKPLAAVTLNASTYTAIPVPEFSAAKTFLLQCDAAIDVSLSDTSDGTLNYTLKSGATLAMEAVPQRQGNATYILCYAKSASATPALQILQLD